MDENRRKQRNEEECEIQERKQPLSVKNIPHYIMNLMHTVEMKECQYEYCPPKTKGLICKMKVEIIGFLIKCSPLCTLFS